MTSNPTERQAAIVTLLQRKHPGYDMTLTDIADEGSCLVVRFVCVPEQGPAGAGLSACRRVACIVLNANGSPEAVLWSHLLPEPWN